MEFDEHAVYQEQGRYTTVVLSPRFQPVLGHVGAHVSLYRHDLCDTY